MTGNLQFKRGLKSNLPFYELEGTPLWCLDTNELYMGTGNSVVKVGTQRIKNLSCSPQISLEINTVHNVQASDTVHFILPSVNDYEEFNQILVQLYMPNIVSIDLGTETFFNGKLPNLDKPGTYNIIYEFDKTSWTWVCGAIYKGLATE